MLWTHAMLSSARRNYLKMKCAQLFLQRQANWRRELIAMISFEGHFYFNGIRVCNKFSATVFRSSNDIQISVLEALRSKLLHRDGLQNIGPETFQKALRSGARQRKSIVSYLERFADLSSHQMPDNSELYLPFFQNFQVNDRFVEEYRDLHDNSPPSSS